METEDREKLRQALAMCAEEKCRACPLIWEKDCMKKLVCMADTALEEAWGEIRRLKRMFICPPKREKADGDR